MKQKSCHRFIFKLHSTMLREAKWNLELDLSYVRDKMPECIVSLSSSQILRFIDELNGITDIDEKARRIKRAIKDEKKKPRSHTTMETIRLLYDRLYNLQFQKDYLCVIMDRNSDYDRANKGFTVNGVRYRRFLGTNGGIKKSTIVYVNEDLYPILKKRLDNNRSNDIPLVPAKLEAYQGLICSQSTPIPWPRVIVVQDCITHFKDDVIVISDETDDEPKLEYVDGYDIEHNDSDGYGLMTPEYSRRVNMELTGLDTELSGLNSRCSWTKGMLFTFDFVEFAEKVAGTYMITDAWGTPRDVREADVILTVSMLKLWNCYESWEHYYDSCMENHYEFCVAKVAPEELEPVRNMNYQFLQSYEFTDEEIEELCKPTIDEIEDVLGMDYRKTIVFMAGFGLNEKNAFDGDYDFAAKALMVEPECINDPYIRKTVMSMIKNRIDMAKKGCIRVDANFAMISGDPYALCQSMFGMEVTGLLKAGEIYHKYWINKGSTEVACFRAPMTSHSNIRKMKLCLREDAAYWYRFIKTTIVLNAWDTCCDAMNGCDFDGDTFMCTDNPIILRKTRDTRTIMCMQKSAKKKIVTEEDIIAANKIAFNDDIGVVTNHITSMIERQAAFPKDSEEYKILDYRIMCGQHFQQNTIKIGRAVW